MNDPGGEVVATNQNAMTTAIRGETILASGRMEEVGRNSQSNNGKRVETQIAHHCVPPPLPSGKVIDIGVPTTSTNENQSPNSTTRRGLLVQDNNVYRMSPTEAPSGSGTTNDEPISNANVPRDEDPDDDDDFEEEEDTENRHQTTSEMATSSLIATTSNASSSSSSSAEIATIDTDTDDDVILIAPPMEVIEVDADDDDDEEDVQIVSHTRSQPIPKPILPERPRLMTVAAASHGPPVLPPPPQFEIEEEIDNNLPVGDLLDDLLNSHFGTIDFDLPLMEAGNGVDQKLLLHPHQDPMACRGQSITEQIRMINNVEIAIQTEVTCSQEVGTQTDPLPETKKRKWEYNDEDGDGTACPICLEPWEESGEHRLVSLKCGHLFGESCLSTWFNQQGNMLNKKICPVCRTKAMPHHIRPLFARRIVQIKYEKINELRQELAKYKKRCAHYEQQFHRHPPPPPTQQAPLSLQQIPPPMTAHHGPVVTATGHVHATGPYHPTNTAVSHPQAIERLQVYPPHSIRLQDFFPIAPYQRQIHPSYALEHEYSI